MSSDLDPSIFDFDLESCDLFDGAMVLCQQVKPSFDKVWVETKLAQMAKELEDVLVHETHSEQKLGALLRHFYHVWGFQCDYETFYASKNHFLDTVLERRQGIPVTLGTLLLYFCDYFDLPVDGVLFPSQLILQVRWGKDNPQYINPSDGEYLSRHQLQSWLIGEKGPLAKITPCDLEVADVPTTLGRWLAVMKGSLLNERKFDLALNCSDIALGFVPDDPFEIRDRGFIYQQLEYNQMAVDDYQYFIEQCPEDPSAKLLELQVVLLGNQNTIIH